MAAVSKRPMAVVMLVAAANSLRAEQRKAPVILLYHRGLSIGSTSVSIASPLQALRVLVDHNHPLSYLLGPLFQFVHVSEPGRRLKQ